MNSRLVVKPIFVALMLSLTGSAHTRAQLNTASTTSAPVDQDTVHEGRWRRSIESDLIEEKFDDLDRMAEEYRRDKSRLPGGDWKLRVFYEALDAPQQTDKDSAEHLEHLQKWMKLRPESITARVALATSLHRWAWVARGNGFANTVTPEGRKLFVERSHEADIVLEGSRDMKHPGHKPFRTTAATRFATDFPQARQINTVRILHGSHSLLRGGYTGCNSLFAARIALSSFRRNSPRRRPTL